MTEFNPNAGEVPADSALHQDVPDDNTTQVAGPQGESAESNEGDVAGGPVEE